jgi:phosphatidylglycerophosphate synthase
MLEDRFMSEAAAAPLKAPSPPASNARPLEIEEPLNRWFFHPIAAALVEVLVPTGISPNAVSVIGVVNMALACACYALLPWPTGPLIGLVFHLGWHIFDGADGQLARRTGKSSPMGEIIDGICDHVSHIILYLTLGHMLALQIGAPLAWTIAVASGFSRALQAMSYESARRSYRRWVHGVNWIRQDVDKAAKEGRAGRLGASLASGYLAIATLVRADDHRIEQVMARAASAGPETAAAARALYQQEMRPRVLRAFWLSTDYETLGVFATLLVWRSPLEFLLFQALALNLWMAWCVEGQRRSYRRLIPQIEAL